MRRKSDNKGWSFVEILVVVAIMSISLGIFGFGIGMISGKPAEECAQKLASSLQNAGMTSLGKYLVSCQISRDSVTDEVVLTRTICNSYANYAAGTFTVDTAIIGEKDVTVEYALDDGTHDSIDTAPLILSYDRTTGGFLMVTPTAFCTEITVSKDGKVRTIELIPPTGRVSLN